MMETVVLYREITANAGPFSQDRFREHISSVNIHDLSYDGQTHARTFVFGFVMALIEHFENFFTIGGVETYAIVFYFHFIVGPVR